ncbi:MAG: hypothetical protein ACRDJE_15060 [Dehalococcoidia bacterium]
MMGKGKLLLGGLLVGGIATAILIRRRGRSDGWDDYGYDDDAIDAAGQGDTFGDRPADAPEQRWAPAQTEHGVTAEQLSMAARVETSWDAIHTTWPSLTLDEVRPAEGDLDRLAGLIAEKVEQPRDEVRSLLEAILAQETPDPSFPAH